MQAPFHALPLRLPAWLLALSPSNIKTRLAAASASQAAAGHIISALGMHKDHTESQASSLLDHAWDTHGSVAIQDAMAVPCWIIDGSSSFKPSPYDLIFQRKLITPAEALAMMPTQWAQRFAPFIPDSHWAHRTQARDAWEWELSSDMRKFSSVCSVGPMLRLCARSPRLDPSLTDILDLVSQRVGLAGMDEGMACLQLLQDRHTSASPEILAKIKALAQAGDIERFSGSPKTQKSNRTRL